MNNQDSHVEDQFFKRIFESCSRLKETDPYKNCKLPDLRNELWQYDAFHFIKMFPFEYNNTLLFSLDKEKPFEKIIFSENSNKFFEKINSCRKGKNFRCYDNLVYLLNYIIYKSGRFGSLFEPHLRESIRIYEDKIEIDEEIKTYVKEFSSQKDKKDCFIYMALYKKNAGHAVYAYLRKIKGPPGPQEANEIQMFMVDANGRNVEGFDKKYRELSEILSLNYQGLTTVEYNNKEIFPNLNTSCSFDNQGGMCILFSHYLTILISLNPQFHPGDLQYILSKIPPKIREFSIKYFYSIIFDYISNYEYIQFIIHFLNIVVPYPKEFEFNPKSDYIDIFFSPNFIGNIKYDDILTDNFKIAYNSVINRIKNNNNSEQVKFYLTKLQTQLEKEEILKKQFIEQVQKDFASFDKQSVCKGRQEEEKKEPLYKESEQNLENNNRDANKEKKQDQEDYLGLQATEKKYNRENDYKNLVVTLKELQTLKSQKELKLKNNKNEIEFYSKELKKITDKNPSNNNNKVLELKKKIDALVNILNQDNEKLKQEYNNLIRKINQLNEEKKKVKTPLSGGKRKRQKLDRSSKAQKKSGSRKRKISVRNSPLKRSVRSSLKKGSFKKLTQSPLRRSARLAKKHKKN